MSKHIGGSRPMMEHTRALQTGVDSTWYDCFKETYMRKDGSYFDERSRLRSSAAYLMRRHLVVCPTSTRFTWTSLGSRGGTVTMVMAAFLAILPRRVTGALLHPHRWRTSASNPALRRWRSDMQGRPRRRPGG